MEADLHNLTVSVGELNADRSNYRFGVLPHARKQHGQCNSKVDFKQRVFEPRDDVKGKIACFGTITGKLISIWQIVMVCG